MHEWSEYWGTCDVSEVSVSPQHLRPCDVVLMGAMAGAFDGSTGVLLKFKGIDQNIQCCTLFPVLFIFCSVLLKLLLFCRHLIAASLF